MYAGGALCAMASYLNELSLKAELLDAHINRACRANNNKRSHIYYEYTSVGLSCGTTKEVQEETAAYARLQTEQS